MGSDSSCSLLLVNRIFGELPILSISGIKGCGKLINLYMVYKFIHNLYAFINFSYEINLKFLMYSVKKSLEDILIGKFEEALYFPSA